MNPNAEAQIETWFKARLLAMPDAPTFAWPNVKFEGTPTFAEVVFFRNTPSPLTLDGKHILRGIVQVTICTELGAGTAPANQEAAKFVSLFPAGNVEGAPFGLAILRRPTIAGAIPDDAFLRTPVSIEYQASA